MGYWQNKRVFITGHTGFKGSWMTTWLSLMGAKVKGYALEPPKTDPSMFDALGLCEKCDHVIGDVRDAELLARELKNFAPEFVFHMAAQPLVRYSYREPIETYQVNVMGTANLLEACRALDSILAIVNITTDKVYENKESPTGYREIDSLGGSDPYSSSKACSELVTRSYRESYFKQVPVLTARAGNIIGGGDWSEDRMIPDAVRAFARREPVKIRNPHSVRPWQHVLDPLRGYLALAENFAEGRLTQPHSFNFGPPAQQCVSVESLLQIFSRYWGPSATWVVETSSSAPKETSLLKLDSELARTKLGWTAQLPLEKALLLTAEWYLAFYEGLGKEGLWELTTKQVHANGQ